ncbi:efflux RND transporter periplasmic adaptor subunit [Ewingella americana]|uniref:efflux RND transporter periplasmic adaptor subunit n=1 Tax=Ewingella americana TaxID=41202 RepID=UPI001E5973AA|nr:efflux RND transporter periplasmic adaptor subunit [Ewingella americana]
MNSKIKPSKTMAAACVAILMLLAGVVVQQSSSTDQGPVEFVTVSRGDIEKTVLATGTLKPSLQVNVGAQVNGQLTKVHVRQGDQVQKGQLLAEIDPTLQLSELRKSQAELASAEAQKRSAVVTLRQFQLELNRQLRLDRDSAGTKSILEQAQARVATQKAQIEVNQAEIVRAQMSLETAQANLGFTRIGAPIDGVVLGIVTQEGQTIVSSQSAPTILVLADVSTMSVHTRISEADILKVKVGQPLWFHVLAEPQRRYDSQMQAIQDAPTQALQDNNGDNSSQDQPSAVYYNGMFNIANPQGVLRTSMTAQVFVVVEQAKSALLLPVAALGAEQGENRYQVQVLKQGRAESRLIKVGINDRQFVEVLEGLQEGEQVMVTAVASAEFEHG